MPKTFDISMLQAKLNEYIKEMSDLMTSEEEVRKYTDFCSAIFVIKTWMDYYYMPDSSGKLPLMDERLKLEMMNNYRKAIDEAMLLISEEEAGPVGIQMNSIVKEMLPLLHSNHKALEKSEVR